VTLPDYAELHALSNFSFQRGASHPEELVERAQSLGYRALALTDECSVAGVVRAHQAARACGLPFIPGAEFRLHQQALRLLVLPHDVQGWGHLCEFITAARQAGQGSAAAYRVAHGEAAFERLQACEIILCPLPEQPINPVALADQLGWAAQLWRGRLWLAVHLQQRLDDALRLEQLEQLAERYGVPLLAAGGVLMHKRSRAAQRPGLLAHASAAGRTLSARVARRHPDRGRALSFQPGRDRPSLRLPAPGQRAGRLHAT